MIKRIVVQKKITNINLVVEATFINSSKIGWWLDCPSIKQWDQIKKMYWKEVALKRVKAQISSRKRKHHKRGVKVEGAKEKNARDAKKEGTEEENTELD